MSSSSGSQSDSSSASSKPPYVSRAGLKLRHGLDAFSFDVTGLRCADFGCNVGGFTDCLLQAGAAHVHAIDTGYGTLDYRLRVDERVTVMERTNALHADAPDAGMDLVVIDLAWTPQRHALPAARRWLAETGHVITLVKPHYELDESEKRALLKDGRLDPSDADDVLQKVMDTMPSWGFTPLDSTLSPITGRKSARKAARKGQVGPGNVEFLVLCRPTESAS